jgi:hypothetical protein
VRDLAPFPIPLYTYFSLRKPMTMIIFYTSHHGIRTRHTYQIFDTDNREMARIFFFSVRPFGFGSMFPHRRLLPQHRLPRSGSTLVKISTGSADHRRRKQKANNKNNDSFGACFATAKKRLFICSKPWLARVMFSYLMCSVFSQSYLA